MTSGCRPAAAFTTLRGGRGANRAIAHPPAIVKILLHPGLPVEVPVPAPARQLYHRFGVLGALVLSYLGAMESLASSRWW